MRRLEGQTALVTGAGQGIGHSIAEAFEREGAEVVALDRNEELISAYRHHILVDLADLNRTQALIEEATALAGPIDILVNAAGICKTQPLLSTTLEDCKRTFDVNFFSPFILSQCAGQIMADRGHGVILNITSISAFLGKPDQADYGATKAALVSLTRSLAAALGPRGVRANAIAPGVIDTPLTQSIAAMRGQLKGISPEETLRPTIETIPLRRIGDAGEVADLAVFLASKEASYISGQTIDVCGGFLMR